jgi:anti-sigma factor RsiW
MSRKKQTINYREWVDEITCKEFVEWVTDYLEGKLPAEERRQFDAHLAQCSGCPHYLEQIRETMRVEGELKEESIEPQARSELLGVFRKWKAESGNRRSDV